MDICIDKYCFQQLIVGESETIGARNGNELTKKTGIVSCVAC